VAGMRRTNWDLVFLNQATENNDSGQTTHIPECVRDRHLWCF